MKKIDPRTCEHDWKPEPVGVGLRECSRCGVLGDVSRWAFHDTAMRHPVITPLSLSILGKVVELLEERVEKLEASTKGQL
jgi:hypothetical protein